MRRTSLILALCLVVCLAMASAATATTIKDGTLTYSAGHYLAGTPLQTGYDPYGYNYQAHLFNGSYANVYLGRDGFPAYEGDDAAYLAENPEAENHWTWPYRDVTLGMKWNDQWLSNQDRDLDGALDRHWGYPSYIGSGAWETNHQQGSYELEVNGKTKRAHWTYFVKIVAAPGDGYTGIDPDDSVKYWYDVNGVEIGPEIWGAFAKIQMVENDPFAGIHGKQYGSPAGPGFGKYGPE